jgi:hypothetical protein
MSVIEGSAKNSDLETRKPKEYPEDFGKRSDTIIARALKKRFSPLIMQTETATAREDQEEKADIWIDFGKLGIVAVQLTFTDNPENLKKKREQVRKKGFSKKEERSDALIKYGKNAHLVLAEYNKGDMARAWKEYEEKASQEKTLPEDFVGEHTLMHIMGQIIGELPSHTKRIIVSELEKMKRPRKTRPR